MSKAKRSPTISPDQSTTPTSTGPVSSVSMSTLQDGGDPSDPTCSFDNGAGTSQLGGNAFAILRLRANASALATHADTFRTSTLDAYQAALDALSPGMVQTAGQAVISDWTKVDDEANNLDVDVELACGGGDPIDTSMPPDPNTPGAPENPKNLTEVLQANRAVNRAEYQIGFAVTMQEFGGVSILGGRVHHYETGDVPTFVRDKVAQATRVLGAIDAIAKILESPALKWENTVTTSNAQDEEVARLVLQLQTHMEEAFLQHALKQKGLLDAYLQGPGNSDKVRHHHGKLLDEAAITKNHTLSADPALLEKMRHDADAIESEVKARLSANAALIDLSLSHYTTANDLDLFFAMLDRRDLIDGMLSRGDTSFIQKKLDASTRYRGRRYNKSLDIGNVYSLSANAGDIITEMGRQTPGALCEVASGVFKGMSHIPVIGGTMDDASKAFDELSKYADEKTGASDIGRKWRNAMAKGTGIVLSALMQGGAGEESEGAEVVETANAVGTASDAVNDVQKIKDEVMALKDVYDSAKVFWGTVIKSLEEIPLLLGDLASGDWVGAIGEVDKVCDNLIGQVGGGVKRRITYSGKKAKLKELDEKSARGKHQLALARFALVSSRLGTKDPSKLTGKEMIELKAAAAEVKSSAKERFEGKTQTVMRPELSLAKSLDLALGDFLKETLVDIFVYGVNQLRKMLRDAILKSVQQAPLDPTLPKGGGGSKKKPTLGDRPGWRAKFGRLVVDGAKGLAPDLIEAATDELKDFASETLSKLVMMAVKKKWPTFAEAAEPAVNEGIKWLITYADKEYEPAKFLEEPIEKVLGDLATAITTGVGFKPAKEKPETPGLVN